MTRNEFMQQAVASGKPKEEIRRIYDSIEAAGEFDNEPAEVSTKQDIPAPAQPAAQPKPTYEQRVQQRADEAAMQARRSGEKTGGINALLAPTKAFTGTMAAHLTESAPYRGIGWLVEQGAKGFAKAMPGTAGAIATGAGAASRAVERVPEPVKNAAGIAGDITMMLPGSVGIQQMLRRAPAAAAGMANKAVGRAASELSGVSEEALRTYGTGLGKGAKALKSASGTQAEIGNDIVNKIRNLDEFLPEKEIIREAIPKIPPVEVQQIIDRLASRKIPEGMAIQDDLVTNGKIDDWINMIKQNADENGLVPAQKIYEIRKRMDSKIEDAFGKESNDYSTALKMARHDIAESLVSSAERSGIPEYSQAMETLAYKLQKVDQLKSWLGKSAQVQDSRAQQFVSTLFGKNKEQRQQVINDLGEIFGTDYIGKSKMANLASELGPEGAPGMLPRQFTGKSALGTVISGGLATQIHNPLAWIPMALSSPRIAAAATAGTGGINRIAQIINAMGKEGKYNPNILKRGKKEGPSTNEEIERLSHATQDLRITPEKLKSIEGEMRSAELKQAEEDALKRALKDKEIEEDVYMENLPKKPVITIEDLKKSRFKEKMTEGKNIKKTGNKPGDISFWHTLGNQRGSVGGYNKEAIDNAIRMIIERAKNPKIEPPSAAPYSKEELDDAIRIFLENLKNNRGDVSNLGILAGTGAGAAAGLGAYGAMKRKEGEK